MGQVIAFPGVLDTFQCLPKQLRTEHKNPGIFLDVLRGSDRIGMVSFSRGRVLAWTANLTIIDTADDIETAIDIVKREARKLRVQHD